MTPLQKIKWLILIEASQQDYHENDIYSGCDIRLLKHTASIDDLYEQMDDDVLCEATEAVRCNGQETGLPTPYSRHYEVEAVASQLPDGSWVGWNYWFGGGKHGEPEAINWMEGAYHVYATERVAVVHDFSLVQ